MPEEGNETGGQEQPKGQEPTPAAPAEPKGEEGKPSEPQTFDADYVKQLRAEAAKHRTEAQEAKAKAQQYEDAQKSELEKAQGKATKAEQAKAEAEAKLLRYEVARDKKVPAEAVDLLNGSTREELEASADKINALVKDKGGEAEPEFDGGARTPAPEADPEKAHNNTFLELAGLQPRNK